MRTAIWGPTATGKQPADADNHIARTLEAGGLPEPTSAPEYVILTSSLTVFSPEDHREISIAAGTRLKISERSDYDLQVEYREKIYSIPAALTKAD